MFILRNMGGAVAKVAAIGFVRGGVSGRMGFGPIGVWRFVKERQ